MSYAALTDCKRLDILRPTPAPARDTGDATLNRMVKRIRESGTVTLHCDRPGDERHAATVARWLMNELCEPVSVRAVDGGLLFTRERTTD